MTRQLSFTKYEQMILPSFRQQCSNAESTEDLKKFFSYSAVKLMENIFGDTLSIEPDDIVLKPSVDPYYAFNERLLAAEAFAAVWHQSDLPRLMSDLARLAVNRYRHLEKHPEKTNSKIRM